MNNQKQIKKYYEDFYTRAPEARKGFDMKRIRTNFSGFHIKKGSRVIDIGCGTGGTLTYLEENGLIPFGIDISRVALCQAQSAISTGGVVQANAEALPFSTESMDGVLFIGTLEHFLDIEKALEEAIRVCKPESTFCFVVPNLSSIFFKFLGGTEQDQEEAKTLEEWSKIFTRHGLRTGSIYRDIGPSVKTSPFLRSIARSIAIILTNFLPIRFTYQLIFICKINASNPDKPL